MVSDALAAAWTPGGGPLREGRNNAVAGRSSSAVEWEVCPMLKRLPKVHMGADWSLNVKMETDRSNFMEVTNLLWNNPGLSGHCLGFLRKAINAPPADQDRFESPPTSLARVDKALLTKWLGAQKVLGLSAEWLDFMDCKDEDFIHELMSLVLALSPVMTFPAALKESKALLIAFFDFRAAEVGRLPHVHKHLGKDTYDRARGGAYQLFFEEGTLSKIRHCSGVEALCPSHIHVSAEYCMTQWYSDLGACLTKHPAKHHIHDFFPAGAGPHLHSMSKSQLQKAVLSLVKGREELASMGAVVAVGSEVHDGPVLVKSREMKQEQLREKARQTLVKHKEMKTKKAQIALK